MSSARDALARELVGAARTEHSDATARELALNTVLAAYDGLDAGASQRRAITWASAAAAMLALAAGWALLARSSATPDLSISATPERVPAVVSAREAEPKIPQPTALSPGPELPKPRPARAVPTAPSTENQKPLTLSEEITLLDRARTALQGNDFAGTLATLDEHARRPGARLGDEATLLRIEALSRAGRDGEASELAARFVAANPGSTLADRARTFVKSKKPEEGQP
jgi:hypothetical protein